jgi:hypothetical protein
MASWELVVTGNSKATISKHNKVLIGFLSILNLFRLSIVSGSGWTPAVRELRPKLEPVYALLRFGSTLEMGRKWQSDV